MHDGCNHGSAETANAPAAAPQGGPARRSAYWRSVEQLANTPEFQAYMHREFQPGASEASEDDRRSFIKVMGASFALAGLAAAKVPMFAVHGDTDVVVPHKDNTLLLMERYEALGGKFTVKIVPGIGHKVDPSFFACP